MKIYWTINSIPELAGLPRRERGQIWREAYRKTLKEKKVWLALLACGLCAGLGAGAGSILGRGMMGIAIGGGVGGGIGGFIFGQVASHAARPHLRAILARKENGPTAPP